MASTGQRKRKWGFGAFVLIVLSIGFLLSAAEDASSKWARLWCEYDDVDINTGRIRQTHYVLYFKVSVKVEDSILTQTIGQFPDGIQPDWRPVNTFPLGRRYSPHHSYHGAIGQIRRVEMIWQLCSLSDEAKKHVARMILHRWQSGYDYFRAERYIDAVWDIAREKTESNPKAIITVTDLAAVEKK